MTGKAHQTCTCDYVTCDRNGAPDSYLWLRDVWQEWRTKFVPVITWRVTGMTHQTRTCDYVTCDRNDAPDSYLWLRDACFTLVNYRHLARSRGNNNDNHQDFHYFPWQHDRPFPCLWDEFVRFVFASPKPESGSGKASRSWAMLTSLTRP